MTGLVDEFTIDNASLGLAQPVLTYIDLRVRIRARDERADAYPVEAWITDSHGASSRGGDAYFAPDWSRLNDTDSDPEAYGLHLFYSLFSGSMASVYDRAAGLAEASTDRRLRLHIWIADGAPELHAIFWERMYHQRAGMATPVSAFTRTPFSRYVDTDIPAPGPESINHLRLLYVCSNPLNLQSKYNLVPIDVETEVRDLITAVKSLRHTRRLSVTVIPGITGISQPLKQIVADLNWTCVDGLASVNALIQHLADPPGYQVVHFLGHGRFSRSDSAATLYFEGRSGNAHIVKDQELGSRLLALEHLPDLVFLAACESAKRHPELGYPQVGFAPQLIRAGVKAVVAMQDPITTQTARRLTTEFYQSVLDHGIVDVALNQARFAVYTEDQRDWWVPALATCLQDGVLFKPDTVRSMLDAMVDSDLFNPLPLDADYIPCDVVHLGDEHLVDAIPQRQHEEIGGVFDRILGIPGDADFPSSPVSPVVVLSGAGGMGKSMQLKRLGYTTAADSLHAINGTIALPVFMDLSVTTINSVHELESLCFDALKLFQNDLDEQIVSAWLEKDNQVFRFLIDGLDVLSSLHRSRLWRMLASFILMHPQHQYVVAYHERITDLTDFESELALNGGGVLLDIVQIQPLSEIILTDFLRAHSPEGTRLAQVIVDKKLTDVAVYPWVLVQLLDSARRNKYPASMTSLVGDLLAQSVDRVTPKVSLRLAVLRSLGVIAYRMQSLRRTTMTIDDVFTALREVRGQRAYDLEAIFTALNEQNILVVTNGKSVRFNRSIFQAYSCAVALKNRPDAQSHVTEISAAFGTHSRLRWWADVFVFLAGLGCTVNVLLQQLLFGSSARSSEMLVLAARILQESNSGELDDALRQYVISSLMHQVDIDRDIETGMQCIDVLTGFGIQAVSSYLSAIALGIDSNNLLSQSSLNSRLRLRAVNGLRRLDSPDFTETAKANVALAELLHFWEQNDVVALAQYVVDHDTAGVSVDTQSIAIFALADMRSASAFDIIMQAFVFPDATEQTLEAITTAVVLINPDVVHDRIIMPYIENAADGVFSRLNDVQNRRLKPYILAMITALRISSMRLLNYARDTLTGDALVENKLAAVQALGALRGFKVQSLLEQIALGDVSTLDDALVIANVDLIRLQEAAILSLIEIADESMLERLAPVKLDSDMGFAMYRLTEAVLWRKHNNSLET